MDKQAKDVALLLNFIKTYCHYHHRNQDTVRVENTELKLCSDCCALAKYAVKRRLNCPKNPKPACKKCDTHCYAPKYRKKIQEVMKFSGIYYMKRGRIDYLLHYFT
ncbi:hypothetical protein JOC37_000466 [Desulfohalotomaculum tongense]|uniref:nitrous oxide-stimulated promoter family protein n=1 Tax=Desulforadius tongensis TaxID=1216062 RepID=UPI00195B7B74|nr:hypothetical protein [Desulforadius tongensis]